MEEERIRRRLTTILAADVAGYSRLTAADEEGTLRTLKAHREIIDRLIHRHDGRIFATAGDSVLAEFGSAVEAVRCAMTIQDELRIRNAGVAEDRRMDLRIGVNVGDVMVDGDNLFGDGVNVAARLEGIAQPGGVCISGSTFEQVKSKLSIGFEDLGPQEVKNIPHPVPAYRIQGAPVVVVSPEGATAKAGAAGAPAPAGGRRIALLASAAIAVLAIGGGTAWVLGIGGGTGLARAHPFDGAWNVVVTCPADAAWGAGYNLRFTAAIKDGELTAQHLERGQPGSLTLAGKVEPDGSAALQGNGFTSDPRYTANRAAPGTPYTYRATAKLDGSQGSGRRIDGRPCTFAFAKQ